jgi:hypothetical protein
MTRLVLAAAALVAISTAAHAAEKWEGDALLNKLHRSWGW